MYMYIYTCVCVYVRRWGYSAAASGNWTHLDFSEEPVQLTLFFTSVLLRTKVVDPTPCIWGRSHPLHPPTKEIMGFPPFFLAFFGQELTGLHCLLQAFPPWRALQTAPSLKKFYLLVFLSFPILSTCACYFTWVMITAISVIHTLWMWKNEWQRYMAACELALGAKRSAARKSQVQFKPSTPPDNQTSIPQELSNHSSKCWQEHRSKYLNRSSELVNPWECQRIKYLGSEVLLQ